MNEEFKATIPATPEEIAEAKRRGARPEDSAPAAVTPVDKNYGRAVVPATPEEIELARRRGAMTGPDAAK